MKKYPASLVIFTRDLRLEDNTCLTEAVRESEFVFPVFVFHPEQSDSANNSYFSGNAFHFMLNSLEELREEFHQYNSFLSFFRGTYENVLEKITILIPLKAVFISKDYTPFSARREQAISAICRKKNIDFKAVENHLLNPVRSVIKADGSPYTVFTPYFNKASVLYYNNCTENFSGNQRMDPADLSLGKPVPRENILPGFPERIKKLKNESIDLKELKGKYPVSSGLRFSGGRKEGTGFLKNILTFNDYGKLKDFPGSDSTSHLSPHLKFGTLSVREVFKAVSSMEGEHHLFIRQLFWRDFFSMIGYFFPHVFKESFKNKYRNIPWINDNRKISLWEKGNTGFPIVDAGMRELNRTGFMHNRVRMITASFLIKDLHVDWRIGERYFASKLIDYDPCLNNGNWQWTASTGCDAQPYFRVFNPWLQAGKYDPQALYIRQWLPELNEVPLDDILSWGKAREKYGKIYFPPVVDHSAEAKESVRIFKLGF